jgi:hypothetical protein
MILAPSTPISFDARLRLVIALLSEEISDRDIRYLRAPVGISKYLRALWEECREHDCP